MAVSEKKTTDKAPENRSGRDNARWIFGLVVLFVGVFATLAVISYYFNWKNDYSVLYNVEQDDPRAEKEIGNICGYGGAWIADKLAGRSFGLFGLFIPVILTLIGLRIIRRRPLLFNHSVLSGLLLLILGSLTLGLAFGPKWGIFGSGLGGAYGIAIAEKLQNGIGVAGASILLLAGWILTGVFINSNFINTVNKAGTAVFHEGEQIAGSVWGLLRRARKNRKKTENGTEPESVQEPVEDTTVIRTISEQPQTSQPEQPVKPVDNEPEMSVSAPVFEPPVTINDTFKPGYQSEPKRKEDSVAADRKADGDDGFVEVDLSEQKDDSKIKTIVVEEHQAAVVDEKNIEKKLYDPLKDVHNYKRPPVDLLDEYRSSSHVSDEEITFNKKKIEETLANFGIPIREMKATIGPTVTLYEIVQEQGVKISRIQGLENDIAQSLKALGIRIIAPIPGRGTIGIEVPNRDKEIVSMRSAILSKRFQQFNAELPVVIGRTIQNENYVFDLAKMPHLLVAGATGQGKSVGLNAIITSLLYRKHPAQLKFVLIDPKMVEFSLYAKLEKHFLAKMASEEDAIVTDPKKAVYTFNSLCLEMDARLDLCRKAGARNIVEYNEKFVNYKLNPENGHRYLPYIVVVVDEFADLIMTAREVEAPVMRLAQKARAIGIHLIIATQRPDVKVITGGIKANFPARMAFRVMQMIDSRTIIDQPGANQLIGRGDMLFSKDGALTRIQCALVETAEVEKIVDFISHQNGYPSAYALPDYEEAGSGNESSLGSDLGGGAPVKYDPLFADIARDAVSGGQISTSYIQRNYEVGFNRAGRIMTQLERAGIVGPQIGAKQREIKFYDLPSLEAKLQDLGVQ